MYTESVESDKVYINALPINWLYFTLTARVENTTTSIVLYYIDTIHTERQSSNNKYFHLFI